VRYEKTLADLLVGQPGGGEPGDLVVERSQQLRPGRSGISGPRGQSSGAQLMAGPHLPRLCAKPPEGIQCGTEVKTGVSGRPGPAQPFSIEKLDPGQVERPLIGSRRG